jgi:hypothetical protein
VAFGEKKACNAGEFRQRVLFFRLNELLMASCGDKKADRQPHGQRMTSLHVCETQEYSRRACDAQSVLLPLPLAPIYTSLRIEKV